MPLPVLAAMGVGAGLKAFGNLFGGSNKKKKAKELAARQADYFARNTEMERASRAAYDTKAKQYATRKAASRAYFEARGIKGADMPDMPEYTAGNFYNEPMGTADIEKEYANKPGFLQNLLSGAGQGAMDFAGSQFGAGALGALGGGGAPPGNDITGDMLGGGGIEEGGKTAFDALMDKLKNRAR
jgi:hypothetical protein